jgi:TonB family protein
MLRILRITCLLSSLPHIGLAKPVQVSEVGKHPTVSPDGEWIAYELEGEIKKVSIDGGDPMTLARSGTGPDWSSSEHNLIVFRDGTSLVTVDATTGDTTHVTTGSFDGNPAWSPSGGEVAVGRRISLVSVRGGSITYLPCETTEGGPCQANGPTWASIDGTPWIAFAQRSQILKVARRGGTATVVAEGLGEVTEPAWSPDGKWIAFVLGGQSTDTSRHIWLVSANGPAGGLWQITSGITDDHNPAWSPTSDAIYFDRNGTGIWRQFLDEILNAGTDPQLTESPRPLAPSIGRADRNQFIILAVVEPKYPEFERSREIEASVVLSCFVTAEGTIRDIQIVSASTDPPGHPSRSFELAAEEAVRQWRIQPPVKDGEPTGAWIRVPIRFELPGRGPEK